MRLLGDPEEPISFVSRSSSTEDARTKRSTNVCHGIMVSVSTSKMRPRPGRVIEIVIESLLLML